jgi:F-type H+-transporting ATPase subunit epsilon
MHLEIASHEKIIYEGEVALVQLPGAMGSFEILKNHAPLVAVLEKGKVKIIDKERNMFYVEIPGGVVQVVNNRITVLTEP